ncbi:CaiB/BaiF CoA transferase family protein [Arthrobacter bambusae]|uniref:CaiB/BaiF CoA transferase family protein n=1 Tax=Arthrobacter bambusae TaxID=1338426 RepID=UPI0027865DA9|nr:CoA transferase [Arthrobacter bambusae]MDQ0029928.1 crotonobetainyl-CoA:carnitine CoA-transferase CaiB-like acyl-CoA transferase [Arthrobacter bambusae]MDQ0097554.1 crotonobetainyl-CoA:carnitine CoA-transferase CaiB-like acyl-CoA transferase [Arthrobacter bambusae]
MRSGADSGAPLEGIVVADFSRVLAGPLATMTLADLGARVIKVERPGTGDDTRQWAPPSSKTGATYFESVNRNKESVTLDLTDPEDLELARELARRADVLVENFKPGGLAKLGLGYESLAEENRGLVYASISGFGSEGGRDLPGYDFIVQAVGGLMSITGDPQGDAYKVGVALVDVLTAKDATIGILAALSERNSTGRGRRIEVNLLSSLQGALANQGQAYLGAGVTPTRLGNDHPSIVPYQLLATGDDPLAVAVGNDSQFARLCRAIDSPELAADPRFVTNSARVRHRRELVTLLEAGLADAGAKEWQDRLVSVGVPAGRVAGIGEGIAYAESLGLEPTIQVHDADGNVTGRQIRHPITWTPGLPPRTQAPPAIGEHTAEVLDWLRSHPQSKTFTYTPQSAAHSEVVYAQEGPHHDSRP